MSSMNLNQFLSQIGSDGTTLSQHTVLCFKDASGNGSYPLLFFSLFCSQLKKNETILVEVVDLSGQERNSIESKLQTSFLGLQTFYWLKNITEIDEKKRAFWMAYLSDYRGPNVVAFFTHDQSVTMTKDDHVVIVIPDAIDQKTFLSLAAFFCKNSVIPNSSITKIVQGRGAISRGAISRGAISLDAACLLLHYIILLGTNVDIFVDRWLDKIVMPERSLFTLSTSFFAKKSDTFFRLWSEISNDYADVFWVAFWSEQLWRAHQFVVLSKAQQFEQAKKIGIRLPFTFINRDWKLHNPAQLRQAHDDIYAIDYCLKNGGSSISLDLFYSKFLSQK